MLVWHLFGLFGCAEVVVLDGGLATPDLVQLYVHLGHFSMTSGTNDDRGVVLAFRALSPFKQFETLHCK